MRLIAFLTSIILISACGNEIYDAAGTYGLNLEYAFASQHSIDSSSWDPNESDLNMQVCTTMNEVMNCSSIKENTTYAVWATEISSFSITSIDDITPVTIQLLNIDEGNKTILCNENTEIVRENLGSSTLSFCCQKGFSIFTIYKKYSSPPQRSYDRNVQFSLWDTCLQETE